MSNTKINSNTICTTLTNKELRSLLNEITEIGGMDKPKDAKKSKMLSDLFASEKKDEGNFFMDQYSTVKRALELEVLNRFKTNVI